MLIKVECINMHRISTVSTYWVKRLAFVAMLCVISYCVLYGSCNTTPDSNSSLEIRKYRNFIAIRETLPVLIPDSRMKRPARPAIQGMLRLDHVEEWTNESLSLVVYQRVGHTMDDSRISIANLHNESLLQFEAKAGFGFRRVFDLSEQMSFYQPDHNAISQPNPEYPSDLNMTVLHATSNELNNLNDLHRRSYRNFVFANGWGYEHEVDRYRGFQSHGMGWTTGNSAVHDPRRYAEDRWSLSSLYLIGLIANDKPTVYLTENLPRMDEAKLVPTRTLDPFEMVAIEAIAAGDRMYVGRDTTQKYQRAVGGIRAGKACTSCHGCREGELLGAFSYTFKQALNEK